MKLSEAITKYMAFGKMKNKESSMSSYLMHIRHLALYFRDCELETVKFQDIIDYMQAMLNLGWDKNSLVGKASAYKQFFVFFYKQGIVKFDATQIPVPEGERKFPKIIEEDAYEKLMKAVTFMGVEGARAKSLLGILWDTGVRLNELRSLNVPDMDTKQMRAVIKTEKSRGIKPMRMVFWTKETNKNLVEYIKLRADFVKKRGIEDDGALFINTWNRWGTTGRWGESAIEGFMKQLSYRANLGYIANPHRFRHHFGRKLALQGANNSVISDMMGHSSMENTRIYTVMNEQMMEETYRKHFRT